MTDLYMGENPFGNSELRLIIQNSKQKLNKNRMGFKESHPKIY
jgi:hypothetical protein